MFRTETREFKLKVKTKPLNDLGGSTIETSEVFQKIYYDLDTRFL